MIQKLEDESTQIDNSIQSLETNSTELKTMLAQLEDQNENEICVDDAVIVQTPLYRQALRFRYQDFDCQILGRLHCGYNV